MKLFLKGERCYDKDKCAIDKGRPSPGPARFGRRTQSDYNLQLREKQRVKRAYGLSEKQFFLTFRRAVKQKGVTGDVMLTLLERRLDNLVFRMGLASSRNQARQIVGHKHIAVNGKLVNLPSYVCKPGDEISIRQKSRGHGHVKDAIEISRERTSPAWVEVNYDQYLGRMVEDCNVEEVRGDFDMRLIIEYYSR